MLSSLVNGCLRWFGRGDSKMISCLSLFELEFGGMPKYVKYFLMKKFIRQIGNSMGEKCIGVEYPCESTIRPS